MNPRLIRFAFALGLLSVAPVRAENAAEIPPPPYALKNKSSFSRTSDDQRAPFWPIGWVKRKVELHAAGTAHTPVVVVPKVVLEEKNFKVTSILLGNPSLAIINGRTYSEGEFLRPSRSADPTAASTVAGGPRTRVYRISDGSVTLQNQEQLLTIALNRPELLRRSDVEDLLTEDRP